MPLTVDQVVALPELGLIVRTRAPSTRREVRWVAVSEHRDPTPWLAGGDLLLTTGMSLDNDPTLAAEYVDRLVVAQVAALGFGVGLTHQVIPATLVTAAERVGLPVLEVPEPVPFVAVGKAVSRLLSAEEYAESAASFECQRRLIRASLGSEPPEAAGVVRVLAKHLGGFALHLDATGHVVAAHPARMAGRAVELSGEVERLRPQGLLASASISTADEHVVILPVGVRGAADGFLVVGSSRPLRSADQAVMNLALSLLSWESSRPLVMDEGMDAWRRLLVSVASERGLTDDLLRPLGLSDLGPGNAVAMSVLGGAGRPVPEVVLMAANRTGRAVFCRRASGGLVGFAGVDGAGIPPESLTLLASADGVRALGVSRVLDLAAPANVRQAVAQADRAAAHGAGMQLFEDGPTPGLTSLIDASVTDAWAADFLGELLTAPEGPELMDTLHAWLDQHGQIDAAAQSLGIHRHTVRHRLRRAEVALGRELDDPSVRADLWFALSAVRAPVGPCG